MGKKKKRGSKPKPHASPHTSKSKKTSKDVHEADTFVVTKTRKGQSFQVPGLSNLGNTCFFNAVMQSVCQSHYFRCRLDMLVTSPEYDVELTLPGSQTSLKLKVNDKLGQLTEKLHSFLSQMHQAGGRTLNPRPVFSEICKQAPRFAGYHQQDSQELLRYLLDSLRNEEIKRIKRAILSRLEVGDKETRRNLTEEDRKDIKAYGIQAQLAPTFVDDVFGGVLKSTVKCKECGNCTTVHETFLDLSLPIPEDKNMKDEVMTSPRGYQTRSKTKGNKSGRGGGNFDLEDSKAGKTPTKELSKHQQKKAKKQQEKHARKAAKQAKRQSLQDFLKEDNEYTSNDQTSSEKQHTISAEENTTEDTNPDELAPEVEVEEAEANVDCQSPDSQGGKNEQASNEDGNLRVETNLSDGSGQAAVMSTKDYVEQVPEPDGETVCVTNTVEHLTEEMAAVSLNDNGTACHETTGSEIPAVKATDSESDGLHKSEGNNEHTSQLSPTPKDTFADSNSNLGSDSLLQGDSVHNKPSSVELLTVKPDSLEESFKKFCTPELLTGTNKFACAVCSKLKQEQLMNLQQQQSEREAPSNQTEEKSIDENHEEMVHQESELSPHNSTTEDGGNPSTTEGPSFKIEKETSERTESPDTPHQLVRDSNTSQEESLINNQASSITEQPSLIEDNEDDSVMTGDGEDERERSQSQVTGSEQHDETNSDVEQDTIVDQNNEDDHGEDEVFSVEDEEEHGQKEESSTVFSDATKQLLIERPPLLLTLHMKRFLQHGRRLRKNNRYVSFPLLLDVGHFCDNAKCKDYFDSNGQLLYSLYGVVQHSGAMQGGHYTAYVKTRTPLKCDKQALLSLTHPPSATNQNSSSGSKSASTEICASNESQCESDRCTSTSHHSETEVKTTENIQTTVNNAGASVMTESMNNSTVGLSNAEHEDLLEGEMDMETSFCAGVSKNLNFDPSITNGQWYFVSDSHVKTASESEVLKCQAYLLFYERLSLQ